MALAGEIAGASLFAELFTSSDFVGHAEKMSNAEMNAAIRLRGGVPYMRTLLTSLSNIVIVNKHGPKQFLLQI